MLYRGKNSTFVWNLIFANNSPGSEDGKPKHDVANWLVLLQVGPTSLLLVGRPVDNQLSSVFHCATTASQWVTITKPSHPPFYTLLPPLILFHDLTRCSVSISLDIKTYSIIGMIALQPDRCLLILPQKRKPVSRDYNWSCLFLRLLSEKLLG